jgi:hypothetical protein
MKDLLLGILLVCVTLVLTTLVQAATVVPTDIQQPGTQPGEISNLESPDKCDNCHGGYNSAVEPAHNWRGSMMAHAGRDPIFWATVAIAEQDFDGSGDLCIRCHSTGGWLAGRSTPTDGSGLAAGDSDGVECDFCHKVTNPDNSEHPGVMMDPFIANDPGPGNNDALFDWAVDWDPDNPDIPDQDPANGIEGYYGSGMASMWGGSDKLGPYNDAEARHQFMQSRFHRDRDFCGTCHDVSNPAVGDLAHNHGAQPTVAGDVTVFNGTPDSPDNPQPVDGKAAFNNPPYAYGIVERTFSEYKAGLISQTLVQDYRTLPSDLQAGALESVYNAATQNGTIDPNYKNPSMPRYFSCQTCHMRPVTGKGANKNGVPVRTDLPLHDMTGGNYWMPLAIEYLDNQGKLRLGGGMSASETGAMLDGALRAAQQLELAATLSLTNNGNSVKIVNHTGHKLISGYPEGRRMWLNIKWMDDNGTPDDDDDVLLREDGAYGPLTVTDPRDPSQQTTLNVDTLLDLDGTNTRIYEAHMGMTREWANQLLALGYSRELVLSYDRITGDPDFTLGDLGDSPAGTEHETFHFVLNNTVVQDNRIPPYGMSYDVARIRNALPVPADQFGNPGPGGRYEYWDEVPLGTPPTGADYADIDLLYQPTSWEYIQFLYLANNTPQGEFLAEEGANMLDAWLHAGADEGLAMARPHVMASTTWGNAPGEGGCTTLPPIPTLLTTTAGDKQVQSTWQPVQAQTVDGYRLYYDQAGKAQLVIDQAITTYTDTGLTNGVQYCYKVTAWYDDNGTDCESDFSNISCATPTTPGLATAGVADSLLTGNWVTSGKGKNATTEFVVTASFTAGNEVVIQGVVQDKDSDPLAGALVSMGVQDANATTVATLVSTASDALGRFELRWQTQKPNKKGAGGTPAGGYTVVTTDVQLNGYDWDGVITSVGIDIQ